MKNKKLRKLKKKIAPIAAILSMALFAGAPVLPVFAATNFIPNPTLTSTSASSSAPDGWNTGAWGNAAGAVFSYPASTTPPIDTGQAVGVSIGNYGTATTGGAAEWYFNPVAVTGGATYTFSDEYLSTAQSSIVAAYTVPTSTTDCAATAGVCYFTVAALPSSGGTWTTTTQTLDAPLDATAVSIYHLIAANGSLTVGNYSLSLSAVQDTFTQGMVTLSFDDGWLSQYTNALPILTAAKIPGTFYIISNAMLTADGSTAGTADTYMTTAEVQAMQAAGEEIGAHTMDHCDLVMLENNASSAMTGGDNGPPAGACASQLSTAETPAQEINGSRSALQTNGFSPVDTFAYPYGSYDANVEALIKADGFAGARSVAVGYNTRSTDPYALKNQIVDATTTFAANGLSQVEDWINAAATSKSWLILTFHNVEPTSVLTANGDTDGTSPQFLQSVVNYLKAQNVCVVTVHQGMQAMGSSSVNPCTSGTTPTPTPTPTSTPPAVTTSTLNIIVSNVNTGGGTSLPSSFTVNVAGGNPSPASFSGNASGTQVIVTGGSPLTITESSLPNYVTTMNGCSGLNIAAGSNATCTITNTFQAPTSTPTSTPITTPTSTPTSTPGTATTGTLNVVLNTVNTGGGARSPNNFIVIVSGGSPRPGAFLGNAAGTPIVLSGGTPFTIRVTSMPNYTMAMSTNCGGAGIAAGTTATCTITETYQAPGGTGGTPTGTPTPTSTPPTATTSAVNVIMTVSNGTKGTAQPSSFTVHAVGSGPPSPGSFAGSSAGTTVTVHGPYVIYATPLPGYLMKQSSGCSGYLKPGTTATCTITATYWLWF